MKQKEKGLIVLVFIIIAIVAFFVIKNNNEKNATNNANEEEFVSILGDGTKLNTSNKLVETKKIDGMEISDIQLAEKDNITLILGTIKNTSDEKKGGYTAEITLLDKHGKEIEKIEVYIKELQPQETTQLNTTVTLNGASAYNFKIDKK